MASSPRPHGVAVNFTLRSTAFPRSSSWCKALAQLKDFRCACAALLLYTLRFSGIRTALLQSRISGIALTACRQSGNEVSVICTFFLSRISSGISL